MPAIIAQGGRVRSLGGRLLVNDGSCSSLCCSLAFWRATPCETRDGCSDPPTGAIYVPTTIRCIGGGSPVSVIGFDNICWFVEFGVEYRICKPGDPGPCVPEGALILNPDLEVVCPVGGCDAAPCTTYIPSRYIPLVACPQTEDAPLVFIDSLLGWFGCNVVSDGLGCYTIDCKNGVSELPPGASLAIVDPLVYRTCCECLGSLSLCNPLPALVGCDDQYPQFPLAQCCCPSPLNDGASMTWDVTTITQGCGQNLKTTIVDRVVGSSSIVDGQVVGSATRYITTNYEPYCGGQCPPQGCTFVEVFDAPVLAPSCPPPIAHPRPCPNTPGETWSGYAECDRTFATWTRIIDPSPCQCSTIQQQSITVQGSYLVTGVNYGDCAGGCSGGLAPPRRLFSTSDLGPMEELL